MAKRANSEGSVYQVKGGPKAGRWVGAVTLAGGRRRVAYGSTRTEAARKLTAMMREHDLGTLAKGARTRVGPFLREWLAGIEGKVRPSTHTRYRQIVENDLMPLLGGLSLERLTPADVETAMRKRSEQVSSRTVHHMRAVLRTALNSALSQQLVGRNSAALAKPPRVPYRPVEPLDPDQARRLLAAARGQRLEALYAVALSLGLRQGEILGLRWEDVDLRGGVLHVRHALQRVDRTLKLVEVKTRGSHRTLNLPDFLSDALQAHRQRQKEEADAAAYWEDHGFVFTALDGSPLDGDRCRRDFVQLLAKAELRPMRFYDLRHSCSSLLLAQGVPLRSIMELLGHSSITLTANTYSHLLPAMRKETAAAWDRFSADFTR